MIRSSQQKARRGSWEQKAMVIEKLRRGLAQFVRSRRERETPLGRERTPRKDWGRREVRAKTANLKDWVEISCSCGRRRSRVALAEIAAHVRRPSRSDGPALEALGTSGPRRAEEGGLR